MTARFPFPGAPTAPAATIYPKAEPTTLTTTEGGDERLIIGRQAGSRQFQVPLLRRANLCGWGILQHPGAVQKVEGKDESGCGQRYRQSKKYPELGLGEMHDLLAYGHDDDYSYSALFLYIDPGRADCTRQRW